MDVRYLIIPFLKNNQFQGFSFVVLGEQCHESEESRYQAFHISEELDLCFAGEIEKLVKKYFYVSQVNSPTERQENRFDHEEFPEFAL